MIEFLLAILLICLICTVGIPAWLITTLKVMGIGLLVIGILGAFAYKLMDL